MKTKLFSLAAVAAVLVFSSCANQSAQQLIASGVELVASGQAAHLIQAKQASVADLTALAKDLPGLASGKQLTVSENVTIGQILVGMKGGGQLNLTELTLINTLNKQVAQSNTSAAVTIAQGNLWTVLNQIAAGINDAVTVANDPAAAGMLGSP